MQPFYRWRKKINKTTEELKTMAIKTKGPITRKFLVLRENIKDSLKNAQEVRDTARGMLLRREGAAVFSHAI